MYVRNQWPQPGIPWYARVLLKLSRSQNTQSANKNGINLLDNKTFNADDSRNNLTAVELGTTEIETLMVRV
jgi:hypothetical protein